MGFPWTKPNPNFIQDYIGSSGGIRYPQGGNPFLPWGNQGGDELPYQKPTFPQWQQAQQQQQQQWQQQQRQNLQQASAWNPIAASATMGGRLQDAMGMIGQVSLGNAQRTQQNNLINSMLGVMGRGIGSGNATSSPPSIKGINFNDPSGNQIGGVNWNNGTATVQSPVDATPGKIWTAPGQEGRGAPAQAAHDSLFAAADNGYGGPSLPGDTGGTIRPLPFSPGIGPARPNQPGMMQPKLAAGGAQAPQSGGPQSNLAAAERQYRDLPVGLAHETESALDMSGRQLEAQRLQAAQQAQARLGRGGQSLANTLWGNAANDDLSGDMMQLDLLRRIYGQGSLPASGYNPFV